MCSVYYLHSARSSELATKILRADNKPMGQIRFYFFMGLLILVGGHWLLNLPSYLLFGSRINSPNALSAIDLKDVDSIKGALSQGYNSRSLFAALTYVGGRHNGIDISAKYGAPVYVPVSGEVLAIGNQDNYCYKKNYGKFMVVKNTGDENVLLFAHLSKILFEEGDVVEEGEEIAASGSSGKATAPHLHFTVFKEGTFTMAKKSGCGLNPTGQDINPLKYLESL